MGAPAESPERETFGIPGHCHDINGDLWHDIGECTAPECSRRPCCGYVERRSRITPEEPGALQLESTCSRDGSGSKNVYANPEDPADA